MEDEKIIDIFVKLVDWKNVSKSNILTIEFLRKFQGYLDWDIIASNFPITLQFIEEFENKINWKYISKNPKIDSDVVKKYLNYLDIRAMYKNGIFNENLLIELKDKDELKNDLVYIIESIVKNGLLTRVIFNEFREYMNISKISKLYILEEDIIRENINKVDWKSTSENLTEYSEDFIEEFEYKINWNIFVEHLLSDNINIDIINLEKIFIKFNNKIQCSWESILRKFKFTEEMLNTFKDDNNNSIWNAIWSYQIVSESFIESHIDQINWRLISQYQILSEDFIRKYKDNVYWFEISSKQMLSEDFIRENKYLINWSCLCNSNKSNLTEQFLIEFKDKLDTSMLIKREKKFNINLENVINIVREETDFDYICSKKILTEEYMDDNSDKLNWNNVSKYQTLTSGFIDRYNNKLNWLLMSEYQNLSEDIMRKYSSRLNWIKVSIHQKLSEDFIAEFKDMVHWKFICEHQKLSEDFIDRFKDRVRWNIIFECQKLSKDFLDKYKENFDYLFE